MKNVKVGDIVKFYDYGKESEPNCYVVGKVNKIKDRMITAEILKQVTLGSIVKSTIGSNFDTPVKGMHEMDRKLTRIELLLSADEVENGATFN